MDLLIMASSAYNIYLIFVLSLISTLLGTAMLVLSIIFQYMGFINSAFLQSTCTQSYLLMKYKWLNHQLQASFIGILIGLLMDIIILIFMIMTVKAFRNFNNKQNPQNAQQALVLSQTKYTVVYALISFGTLGNIVCFGTYLSFKMDSLKDSTTCPFIFNDTNLFILIIISGVWLLTFILIQYNLLKLRSNYTKQLHKQDRKNTYLQMANVTQQPQDISNSFNNRPNNNNQNLQSNNSALKYQKFITDINNDNTNILKKYHQPNYNAKSFNNVSQNDLKNTINYPVPGEKTLYNVNVQLEKQPMKRQYIPKPEKINFNPQPEKINYLPQPQKKQNYKQFRQRQLKQVQQINKKSNLKNPQIQNKYASHQNNNYDNDESPGQRIGSMSNKIYKASNFRNGGIRGQNIIDNETPIRNLNYKQQQHQIKQFQRSPTKYSPQRAFNQGAISKQSYRNRDENTNGQLIYLKKSSEDNRRNQNIRNDKFSSGQVSFKSPNRFESKFEEEEKNYFNNNKYNNSILPPNNIRQRSPQTRKKIFQQGYSSGFNPSSYGQGSPGGQGKGRSKNRQGVLTSFIRGKFN